MGTRSLTIIKDESGTEILTLYRQFDGYPEGHGRQLAKFLNGFKVCNGISSYEDPKLANGAGCLAAQVVAYLKRPMKTWDGKRHGPVGNVYIYPQGTRDVGEEYIYTVYAIPNSPLQMVIHRVHDDALIAEGTPKDVQRKIRNRVRREKLANA